MKKLTVLLALVLAAVYALPAQADYPANCTPSQDRYVLTSGDDTRYYTNDSKCVDALGGDDTLSFNGGTNTAYGDGGADFILGAGGTDILYGGAGSDYMHGNGDEDFIYGDDGPDQAWDGKNPNGAGDYVENVSIWWHCSGPDNNGGDDVGVNIGTQYNSSAYC